jgi:hypothetical protein
LINLLDGGAAVFDQGIDVGLQRAEIGQALLHPGDRLHECRAAL